MPTEIDTRTWARRDAFDFFRGFDKPYFNVCTRLDAAALKSAVADRGAGSFSLAYHFIALRLANQIEPFRYRLQGDRVLVLPEIHGGATVLRDDDSFAFAYMDHHIDYGAFCAQATAAIDAAKSRAAGFDPRVGDEAMVHFTTLPWIHFSSFSHARNWGRQDSVPKISFGRADADGARLWLPLSVEVHHALMDGVHVGRYVQAFESALSQPEAWLQPSVG